MAHWFDEDGIYGNLLTLFNSEFEKADRIEAAKKFKALYAAATKYGV